MSTCCARLRQDQLGVGRVPAGPWGLWPGPCCGSSLAFLPLTTEHTWATPTFPPLPPLEQFQALESSLAAPQARSGPSPSFSHTAGAYPMCPVPSPGFSSSAMTPSGMARVLLRHSPACPQGASSGGCELLEGWHAGVPLLAPGPSRVWHVHLPTGVY